VCADASLQRRCDNRFQLIALDAFGDHSACAINDELERTIETNPKFESAYPEVGQKQNDPTMVQFQ